MSAEEQATIVQILIVAVAAAVVAIVILKWPSNRRRRPINRQRVRRMIILGGGSLVVLSLLFPPWTRKVGERVQFAGYHWFGTSSSYNYSPRVDWARLSAGLLAVVALTAILIYALESKPKPEAPPSEPVNPSPTPTKQSAPALEDDLERWAPKK